MQILYVKAGGENLVPWFDMSGLGNVLHELPSEKDTNACKSTVSALDVVSQAFWHERSAESANNTSLMRKSKDS